MSEYHLPPQTRIGHVHLRVSDLGRALAFYGESLGFHVVKQEGHTCFLSASGEPPCHLLLTERPGARPKPPRTTGLYHVAIRLPNRYELARVLKRLTELQWPFQGFSDHQVSEALYLADPDGNGLELYRDRPRHQWPRRDGMLAMRTDPLDIEDLLREVAADTRPWEGIHPQTDIGHVHLHVADLAAAEDFYHGALGLEVTQRDYPGALFLAAGGYHHHLGVNVWAGVGAPPPPPDAVGLLYFALCLPSVESMRALHAHLQAKGIPVQRREDVLFVRDPSGNGVLLMAEVAWEAAEAMAAEFEATDGRG